MSKITHEQAKQLLDEIEMDLSTFGFDLLMDYIKQQEHLEVENAGLLKEAKRLQELNMKLITKSKATKDPVKEVLKAAQFKLQVGELVWIIPLEKEGVITKVDKNGLYKVIRVIDIKDIPENERYMAKEYSADELAPGKTTVEAYFDKKELRSMLVGARYT